MRKNNEWKLKEKITQMSVSKNWDKAKDEWKWYDLTKGLTNCVCGKTDIINLCKMENLQNGTQTIVGSCCVEQFFGIPTKHMFSGIKSIISNNYKILKADALSDFLKMNKINHSDFSIYSSIAGFKKRSAKQKEIIKRINLSILGTIGDLVIEKWLDKELIE